MTLDEAEKQAHDMLYMLRREYELQAAPYIKILCDIQAIRPRVYYVPDDNGKLLEMIPLDPPTFWDQRDKSVDPIIEAALKKIGESL